MTKCGKSDTDLVTVRLGTGKCAVSHYRRDVRITEVQLNGHKTGRMREFGYVFGKLMQRPTHCLIERPSFVAPEDRPLHT